MLDNTFCVWNSPNPKNHTQTAITQQWIVRFTQTKHQNLPLNILFTLMDSNNVHKSKKKLKKSFAKSQFFHLFQRCQISCRWCRTRGSKVDRVLHSCDASHAPDHRLGVMVELQWGTLHCAVMPELCFVAWYQMQVAFVLHLQGRAWDF